MREKLIAAATRLFHEQGVHRTTLAAIASRAEVPLGNVYYHFRTKDALLDAVIAQHAATLRASFARYEQQGDARAALQSYLQASRAHSAELARYGCPQGSLCQELEKQSTADGERASGLLRMQIDWFAAQFYALDQGERSCTLAEELLARLQGAFVLGSSFGDAAFLERQIDAIRQWLDQLA
ncbi:helix-turn-helix transcriptional regulator [Candidatus Gracilibacteria bacterium]|nr:helix-turn-helix transcriptional regulator [Candidatus Gracilibacteria bacterium]